MKCWSLRCLRFGARFWRYFLQNYYMHELVEENSFFIVACFWKFVFPRHQEHYDYSCLQSFRDASFILWRNDMCISLNTAELSICACWYWAQSTAIMEVKKLIKHVSNSIHIRMRTGQMFHDINDTSDIFNSILHTIYSISLGTDG